MGAGLGHHHVDGQVVEHHAADFLECRHSIDRDQAIHVVYEQQVARYLQSCNQLFWLVNLLRNDRRSRHGRKLNAHERIRFVIGAPGNRHTQPDSITAEKPGCQDLILRKYDKLHREVAALFAGN